jgi:deoxyadenosine/deoxycytidine kinase
MPKPDLYVYLVSKFRAITTRTYQKEGRSYEQEISASYLDKINSGYLII